MNNDTLQKLAEKYGQPSDSSVSSFSSQTAEELLPPAFSQSPATSQGFASKAALNATANTATNTPAKAALSGQTLGQPSTRQAATKRQPVNMAQASVAKPAASRQSPVSIHPPQGMSLETARSNPSTKPKQGSKSMFKISMTRKAKYSLATLMLLGAGSVGGYAYYTDQDFPGKAKLLALFQPADQPTPATQDMLAASLAVADTITENSSAALSAEVAASPTTRAMFAEAATENSMPEAGFNPYADETPATGAEAGQGRYASTQPEQLAAENPFALAETSATELQVDETPATGTEAGRGRYAENNNAAATQVMAGFEEADLIAQADRGEAQLETNLQATGSTANFAPVPSERNSSNEDPDLARMKAAFETKSEPASQPEKVQAEQAAYQPKALQIKPTAAQPMRLIAQENDQAQLARYQENSPRGAGGQDQLASDFNQAAAAQGAELTPIAEPAGETGERQPNVFQPANNRPNSQQDAIASRTAFEPNMVREINPAPQRNLTREINPIRPIGAQPSAARRLSETSNSSASGRPGDTSIEGMQRASVILQKFAPREIQVGKKCRFVIKVRNVGQRSAENVRVFDKVPYGTRLVSTEPEAKLIEGRLVWDLGSLSANDERELTMYLMPTSEGEIGSVAQVSFTADASVKTRCTKPLVAIQLSAAEKVLVGDKLYLKVDLHNPGTGNASNVMIFSDVPENMAHAAGSAIEYEVGTLPAGETRTLTLVLDAKTPGPVLSKLIARADGEIEVAQEISYEVVAPGLQVAIVGPKQRYLERPATYEITVNNPGTASTNDIELVTHLPAGMRFSKADHLGEYDQRTHSVHWSLAKLSEGERGTVKLIAIPVSAGQQKLTVQSRSRSGLSDNAQQEVLVEGLAAIKFEVVDLQDPIEIGAETTYEIRVVNQGSKAASNVQVVMHIPQAFEIVSAAGDTKHRIQPGSIVFAPITQLPPQAEARFRIQARGLQAGDQRVMVEVTTDAIRRPIRKEESTRVYGDE